MQRISVAEYAELFAAVDPIAETERILTEGKEDRSKKVLRGAGYSRPAARAGFADFGRPSDTRINTASENEDSDFRTRVLFPKLREAYAQKTGMRLL